MQVHVSLYRFHQFAVWQLGELGLLIYVQVNDTLSIASFVGKTKIRLVFFVASQWVKYIRLLVILR